MRKRNNLVEVKFTKDELNILNKKAKKAGLSVGGFIRCLVGEIEIKPAPPVNLPELIIQIRQVNITLNKLLDIANEKGEIETSELKTALKSNRQMEKEIVNIYTMRDTTWL